MPWFQFRKPASSQVDAEVRFHIEQLTEEYIASGLSPREARRRALIEFGGPQQIKEEIREVHRLPFLETTFSHLQFALRWIRKSPAFSLSIVATLALGIGANTAVFSAIQAILLQPLPFPEGDQLMRLAEKRRDSKASENFVAPVRLEDWNRLNSTFQNISGYYVENISETSGTLPEKLSMAIVAPRFLEVWGIAPALGRDFSPQEAHFGGPAAVLISDRYWRRRFNAAPEAIGKRVRTGSSSLTIIGVMPANFLFPERNVDLWIPSPADAPYAQSRESTWFQAIGRLKRGVTAAQARANLDSVQAALGRQFPKTDLGLQVVLEPLKESTIRGERRSLWVLFGSVTLLLLIACTNVAALLLARSSQRRHEISVRYSLGASRLMVIRQMLTETFVLAAAGSLAGLLLAVQMTHLLRAAAASLPRIEEVRIDWHIALYAVACSLVATFLCGLAPAWRVSSESLAGSLAQNSRTQVSSRTRLQWMLVGVQVTLAVTLLCGAGLLVRSLSELGRVSPGFDSSHVLTLRINASWGETADMKVLTHRIDSILDGLRIVPGVEAAATAGWLPGVPAEYPMEVHLEGAEDPQRKIIAENRAVSNGYFETMRIPLLAGEGCPRSRDTSTAVVNRSFVNAYADGHFVVGRHLRPLGNSFLRPGEIVGVVGDAREQGIQRAPVPAIYWCFSAPVPDPYYLVRTSGEPMRMAEPLRRKIHELQPARSVFDIKPLDA
ncbi:MAG: ABC transporter permease, partial [Acidobacteriaceae bacterium]|nr:ABC transporter permease [Acidobacteriaceae bacterium]